MQVSNEITAGLIAAFIISVGLTPIIRYIALKKDLISEINHRTIHSERIPRLGGLAIFVSFMVVALFILYQSETLEIITKMKGIMLGSTLMFATGFIDDLCNIKPRTKIIMQVICALILIYFGVCVDTLRLPFGIVIDTLRLPFGIVIDFGLISVLFTIFWIIGITNAVNLMDGLDGLAGGMSTIILAIISCTALIEGKTEIALICGILIASICGFLLFNFHPASIFMGDCGSLFLGFFIAAISLVGFKSSTVMTLALPILILFIPITDVISAILRRTLKHKRFSEADKEHLHHQLMKRFGHRNSVMIICGMTAILGISAFIYLVDKELGLLIMAVIILILEIFIEVSGMISVKFHPILTIVYKLTGKELYPKE